MINNRQANNGRRRGRGGQRQQGGGNNPNSGNRIDNRARGNAAQLLEKYKNLARDAQMAGDRVNTEYYLQFADHYFRVLAETRSRFEDQNPQQRRQRDEFDGDEDEFDGEDGNRSQDGDFADEGDEQSDRPVRNERAERGERNERRPNRDRDQAPRDQAPRDSAPRDRDGRNRDNRERDNRDARRERQPRGVEGEVAPVAANEDEAPAEDGRRARRGRPRRDEASSDSGHGAEIAAVLPPALGVEGEVVEVKPRRRRVKKDEGEPAAAE
ncbi:MAG: hypothetical protein B7Y97_11995 [Sphingomonas sp. 32-66-10]|nr:MAG: hypothetical protein B7Y97_11995 [Sphingomonas sp. 32-66-10]